MNNIDKYTKGELTNAELDAFSEKLIVSKLDRDKKAAWKAKLATEYEVQATERPASKGGIKGYLPWLLVALLLLAAAAYYMTSIQEPEPPIEEKIPLMIASLDIMGDQSSMVRGGNNQLEVRLLANEAYAQKDYAEALKQWQTIETNQLHAMDHFYIGLCYLKAPNSATQEAIIALQKSKEMQGPQEEIEWVLSLAYLQEGAKTKAKETLLRIVDNQSYQHQKAKELLEDME